MSAKARAQEEDIKRKIVSGYKRGVCTSEGADIPVAKRGSSGRGSRFRWKPSEQYRRNFDRIFGVKP